jgi:hypothetical protein
MTMKRSETETTDYKFNSVEELMDHIKSKKYPWYESLYNNIKWTLSDWWWSVYRCIRPCHAPVRAAIPRGYIDGVELIRDVNFAIIKEFYEEDTSHVDWSAHAEHQEFYNWLQKSYEYITCDRLIKDQELAQAWEHIDHSKPCTSKYARIEAIEGQIEQQDDKILQEMMKYRKYFWS